MPAVEVESSRASRVQAVADRTAVATAVATKSLLLPRLPLDQGTIMRDVRIAYQLEGALATGRDNVVLVLHALTGSPDASGDWWRGLIGPHSAIDTTRWAVLSPNLLGSCYGSAGPAEGETFPRITVRDQARAVGLLLERLEIPRVVLAVGGSLGGMVALEFAASFPGRAQRALVFAAPAALGAGAIAWSHAQRRALDTAGPDALKLAREIAMLSYRTPESIGLRFTRSRGAKGGFAVQEWLAHHGERLDARFTAESYRALIDAMDTHDLERARDGLAERLRASGTAYTGVGIPGDLFCPPDDVRSWVNAAGGTYREIHSSHGHDAFLIEKAQVETLLEEALAFPAHSVEAS